MKAIKIVSFVFTVLSILAVFLLWTPDTSMTEMRAKYGSSHSLFLETEDGGQIHYRDQGLAFGRVLVLIHGTGASLHTWEMLVAKLKSDFRIVSLDLPGHGLTGENQARDYSHAAMYQAVIRLMDHLQIPQATLIGNSLGGAVAWQAALEHPERVDALVLIASSGVPSKSPASSNIGFKILKTRWGQALMKRITPRILIMKSLQQTIENKELVTQEMVDRYWELLRLKGNRQAMVDLAQTPRLSAGWQRISSIRQPTLIIWGDKDRLLPVDMSVIFDREIANSQLKILENIGHIPMEEATDSVFLEIMSFCSKQKC